MQTRELSMETLPDFEELAAKQGDCWCMYYQRERPLMGLNKEERTKANRRDKRRLVKSGKAHAVIVYHGSHPVGWCQYGRADELPRIDAGRNYKKLPKFKARQPLWRITCFFVDRHHRKMGVSRAALKGALESIAVKGGGIVEGYPVVSRKMAQVPEWLWFGTPKMFEDEGFRRVSPLGTSLVLMRKSIAAK